MTHEAHDESGGLGPYKHMIAAMATAHGRPTSLVGPSFVPRIEAVPMPTRNLGGLTPSDLVELAQGDASIFGLDTGAVGVPAGTTVTVTTAVSTMLPASST